jgi:hypothetical protein
VSSGRASSSPVISRLRPHTGKSPKLTTDDADSDLDAIGTIFSGPSSVRSPEAYHSVARRDLKAKATPGETLDTLGQQGTDAGQERERTRKGDN